MANAGSIQKGTHVPDTGRPDDVRIIGASSGRQIFLTHLFKEEIEQAGETDEILRTLCGIKLYRLYCGVAAGESQDRVERWFGAHATRYFPGFTLTRCVGFWQGRPEGSVVFELLCGPECDDFETLVNLHCVAEQYNTEFDQHTTLFCMWHLPRLELLSGRVSVTAAA